MAYPLAQVDQDIKEQQEEIKEQRELHGDLEFTTLVLGKDEFRARVTPILTAIENPALKKVLQESLALHNKITVKFVKHAELSSTAHWNGTDRSISIAIDGPDQNDTTDGFRFELFNSINPKQNEINTNVITTWLENPSDDTAKLIIDLSAQWARSQEKKEFWSVKKLHDTSGEPYAVSFESYLSEQETPTLNCHGFSHVEQYQYNFLQPIQKLISLFLLRRQSAMAHQQQLNTLLAQAGSNMCQADFNTTVLSAETQKIGYLAKAQTDVEKHLTRMKTEAEENIRDISLERKFTADSCKLDERMALRTQLWTTASDLCRQVDSTSEAEKEKIVPIMFKYGELIRGDKQEPVGKLLLKGLSWLFDLKATASTLEDDKVLLAEMEAVAKEMPQISTGSHERNSILTFFVSEIAKEKRFPTNGH